MDTQYDFFIKNIYGNKAMLDLNYVNKFRL